MRAMASDFFATNPLLAGPQVAMVIFVIVFAAVIWRVLRARPADYQAQASLPLSDDSAIAVQKRVATRENVHE